MTSALYYRPIADTSSSSSDYDDEKSSNHHNQQSIIATTNNIRANETFCAPYTSPPWSRDHVPILLEWARRISIGVTTLAIRLMMNTYGKYEITNDEHYQNFLELVLGGGSRSPNQGMITVSNHRSLFDDPGIVSCLLPLPIAIQPKYNRWALCSQEYCFNDALPGLIKGYIGAGQVLPICRGGGINQKLLLDFARHLACGEWCHVFPEGGVWQWNELGGRRKLPHNATAGSSSDFDTTNSSTTDNKKKKDNNDTTIKIVPATLAQKSLPPSPIGKLKWGIGKLIAHAPTTPKVIPFAHRGMERLFPQDETTGKTKLRDNLLASLLPRILRADDDIDDDDQLHIRVKFGKEITFDDLIKEHEAKHGQLWKYCGKINAEEQYDKRGEQQQHYHELWDSSVEERALYSKIVRRIESRLDVITREVCGDEAN
ncbi:hypothetical protein ACHAXR_003135 [Thalassiosira sp. AJA248-18]